MTRLQRGDRTACTPLVRLWEAPLLFYLRRLVGTGRDDSVAYDCLQQVWVKMLAGVERLRDPAAFPLWIYRLARNTAVSHMRTKPRVDGLPDDLAAPEPGEDESFDAAEAERVPAALARLSASHREVLTLFFLDDLGLSQIASLLELPEGTVKSRLHYARRALRHELSREDEP